MNDAVRDGLEMGVRNALCFAVPILQEEAQTTLAAWRRPSVLYRPDIFIDGNKWCALLGPDLAIGIAGFGGHPRAGDGGVRQGLGRGARGKAIRRGRATMKGSKRSFHRVRAREKEFRAWWKRAESATAPRRVRMQRVGEWKFWRGGNFSEATVRWMPRATPGKRESQ